jgi:hypothetical protein
MTQHARRTRTLAALIAIAVVSGACASGSGRSVSPTEACPNEQVVTITNPHSLEYDVRYDERVIGTVSPGSTVTLDLPPGRLKAIRLVAVVNSGTPVRWDTPTGQPNSPVRVRVHCAGG